MYKCARFVTIRARRWCEWSCSFYSERAKGSDVSMAPKPRQRKKLRFSAKEEVEESKNLEIIIKEHAPSETFLHNAVFRG